MNKQVILEALQGHPLDPVRLVPGHDFGFINTTAADLDVLFGINYLVRTNEGLTLRTVVDPRQAIKTDDLALGSRVCPMSWN